MEKMRKTPEEIKKGLECCRPIWKSDHFKTCDSACPYVNEGHFCRTMLNSDALALIRQLERDKNWASENYDLIREENKRLEAHILCKIDVINRLEAQNAELVQKVQQLEKERDAAIHDINKARDCKTCKHINVHPSEQPCRSCGLCGKGFEWRGPCEENEEITK